MREASSDTGRIIRNKDSIFETKSMALVLLKPDQKSKYWKKHALGHAIPPAIESPTWTPAPPNVKHKPLRAPFPNTLATLTRTA